MKYEFDNDMRLFLEKEETISKLKLKIEQGNIMKTLLEYLVELLKIKRLLVLWKNII